MSRHGDIAECIKTQIKTIYTDKYFDVRCEGFVQDALPSQGIIVSEEDFRYGYGTSDRDDIIYGTYVARVVHALHNEDRINRTAFIDNMHALFHEQRLPCLDVSVCQFLSKVDGGKVAVPQAWKAANNSVVIVKILTPLRVARG